MKKTAALLLSLMILGCASAEKVQEGKSPSEISVVKKEFKLAVTNLKAQEEKNLIRLSWELNENSDISKIIVTKRQGTGRITRMQLEKNVRSVEIPVEPLQKYTFYVKLMSNSGEVTEGVKVTAAAKMGTAIAKESEYIDTDSETVKFLFKTNKGAKVDFYLGESKDDLKLVKSETDYDFTNGLKITGLMPGKTYFYKIKSDFQDVKAETNTLSFTKIKNDFNKNKAEWARNAVFYEVFVRSFYDSDGNGVGDFRGLGDKMDYLKGLGVDALWLMPSFASNSYHGYDITDYRDVQKEYGTMADFEYMVAKAHEKGIKIIVDYVVNHTSNLHKWFEEAAKGPGNKYYDYYVWADSFDNKDEAGPWDQTVWYEEDKGTYYAVFYSGMPDLNFRNHIVRDEIKDAAKFWLDKGVDGFRLDASKHIDDKDREVTLSWWKEFNNYVKSINKDAFLVGEAWDENPENVAPFLGVMDSSFNFGISERVLETVQKGNVDIAETITNMRKAYKKYSENFIDTPFTRNHDMPRLATELKGNIKKQKMDITYIMTLPGTPFIYYGEELGQKGAKPDEFIREPMDWYTSMSGIGMTKWEKPYYGKPNDGISLEEEKDKDDSIYNFVRKIIKIRKENPLLFIGEIEKIETPKGCYGYKTSDEKIKIETIHNHSKDDTEIAPDKTGYSKIEELISSRGVDGKIVIPAGESIILKYSK